MLCLCTGKPGASKSLNTLASLVINNKGDRPIYYTNIRLLMLDYRVASSFSGWFYGNYLLKLKNKGARKRLDKIIKRVHADDEFVSLSDVPWLESYFDAANHLDTWLFWVRKLYTKNQLLRMEEFISNMPAEILTFEYLVQFNLHFIHFENARDWHLLPKTSKILIDECQQFFPPRALGANVPIHISKFETHRHNGYDVYLITQDRMLLDSNVRKLVNNHVHYHNPFGGSRVTRYEHSKSFDADNYFDLKATQNSLVKRPSNFYGSYFSAEMHTHKFKMPKIFYYSIIILTIIVGLIFSLLSSKLFASPSSDLPAVKTIDSVVKPASKVSIKPTSSTLLSDKENDVLVEFVTKSIDGVFISGSQYIKHQNGLVSYDYSFIKSETGELFEPAAIGFKQQAINDCLVRLTFHDFTTFVTCNPLIKPYKPDERQNELMAAS
jgi:hypothetical protein